MTVSFDPTAWSALVLGLTALFAGIGALRKPGAWRTMIEEVERSPALQFLCGMMELVIGAVVYLTNSWVPTDLAACAMKALGGLMMVEALAILGFVDLYTQMWLKNLSFMHRGWALSTMAFGLVLSVVGGLRLG
ncbi:MAG: hypothetical protein ACKOPM_01610 [Novosphingobium sp.]